MRKQKTRKHHLLYVTTILFTLVIIISYVKLTFGAEPTVGAVNNWFSVSHATRLSLDMTPNRGENGYHFYSLSPFFQGNNYGLYSGIQTNGNLGNGVDVGNIFVFSVWNATVAYPQPGVTATPFGGEGVGYSLRKQYDWVVGRTYTVTIQREAFDSTNNGYRWSATITDKQTGGSLKLGEVVAPAAATELTSGSAFHERYVGGAPSCTASTSNLEAASVTFSNFTSDKPVTFTGTSAPNNIFTSSSCSNYIHYTATSSYVVTGFGVSNSEYSSILLGVTNPGSSNPSTSSGESSSGSGGTGSSGDTAKKDSGSTTTPSTSGDTVVDDPTTAVDESLEDTPTIASDPINEKSEATVAAKENKPTTTFKAAGALAIPMMASGVYFLLKRHIFRI